VNQKSRIYISKYVEVTVHVAMSEHDVRRGEHAIVECDCSLSTYLKICLALTDMQQENPTIDAFVTGCMDLNDIVDYDEVVGVVLMMQNIRFAGFQTLPYASNDRWTLETEWDNTFTLIYNAHWYEVNILVHDDRTVTVTHTAPPPVRPPNTTDSDSE
jgi:hypothetical protein